MNLTDMIAQNSAAPAPVVESMTAEQATFLDQETGIPAAAWREAYNLAGSKELFDIAFDVWRENFVGIVDPRTIVADLAWALNIQ